MKFKSFQALFIARRLQSPTNSSILKKFGNSELCFTVHNSVKLSQPRTTLEDKFCFGTDGHNASPEMVVNGYNYRTAQSDHIST
ncbi:hypothetical protein M514_01227 [Trichuris suis]|uniref:Uncharacterized protein n=1 Tax=Trichuris suis TaxID=68888 RepID=A0A085NMX6_9BILA|nr:hypothetical protein M513_01227 [Trichuris suis]KFD70822.1 hypothetical protein M514_01227 [Trichuris suis]